MAPGKRARSAAIRASSAATSRGGPATISTESTTVRDAMAPQHSGGAVGLATGAADRVEKPRGSIVDAIQTSRQENREQGRQQAGQAQQRRGQAREGEQGR